MNRMRRIIAWICIAGAGWITVSGQRAAKTAYAQTPAGHSGHAQPAMKSAAETVAEKEAPVEEEPPRVEISTDQQQFIGVKTATVAVVPMSKVIRTVGRIEYDERRLATINMKFEGWIEKLHVDYVGRYVNKNEPLAEIYSPELVATQQELLNILKWSKMPEGKPGDDILSGMIAKDAAVLLEAAKQRLKFWDISEAQIQKLEETGRPVRTLTLYCPVSGYIIQKTALQGMRVMPGEKLFDVADLSTLWVLADVYERELPLIKIGQEARITLSYFPEKAYASRIDYVYPSLSSETRTVKVRFTIANPDGQLKPQMFTNVEIEVNLGNWLAVPESAVLDTGQGQVAYVDTGDESFEPRQVSIGFRAGKMVQILSGLTAGEKVAAAANFLIDSEAQLKGVKPLPGQ